jgi:hypothetical protein
LQDVQSSAFPLCGRTHRPERIGLVVSLFGSLIGIAVNVAIPSLCQPSARLMVAHTLCTLWHMSLLVTTVRRPLD